MGTPGADRDRRPGAVGPSSPDVRNREIGRQIALSQLEIREIGQPISLSAPARHLGSSRTLHTVSGGSFTAVPGSGISVRSMRPVPAGTQYRDAA